LKLKPGEPLRYFGDGLRFLNYIGRFVSQKGDKVLVEKQGRRKTYLREKVTGCFNPPIEYVKPKSKRGGIGFGMINQQIP